MVDFWRHTPTKSDITKYKPKLKSPWDVETETIRRKELTISVTEKGEVVAYGRVVKIPFLTRHTKALLDGHKDSIHLFIKSHPNTKYADVTKVLDAVKNGPGIDSNRVNVSLSVRTAKELSSERARVLADFSLAALAELVTDANEIWPRDQPLLKFVTDAFPELDFVRSEMKVTDFLESLRKVSPTIESRQVDSYDLFTWEIRDTNFYAVFSGRKLRSVTRQEKPVDNTNRMARPIDGDARSKFLKIEHIARLPDEQQANQLSRLYRELSPPYMNPFVEAILSTNPRNILQRESGRFDGNTNRWANQLADVTSTMTPEQVADQLKDGLWLNVAARARAIYVFQRHPNATAALIKSDLDTLTRSAIDRAAQAILTLKLREFTPQLVTLFIENEEFSEPIYRVLLFTGDLASAPLLLEQVKKDFSFLIRCNGVLRTALNGKPADPTLLYLLNSRNAEIKFAAASALAGCLDSNLVMPTTQLAVDREARFRLIAMEMASSMSDADFQTVRANLLPLLDDEDDAVKMAALRCFSQKHDLAAGPTIVKMLKQKRVSEQEEVIVMQALNVLVGSNYNYDMDKWGPGKLNNRSIENIEAWLKRALESH